MSITKTYNLGQMSAELGCKVSDSLQGKLNDQAASMEQLTLKMEDISQLMTALNQGKLAFDAKKGLDLKSHEELLNRLREHSPAIRDALPSWKTEIKSLDELNLLHEVLKQLYSELNTKVQTKMIKVNQLMQDLGELIKILAELIRSWSHEMKTMINNQQK